MNRAERRRMQKKKTPTYNIRKDSLDAIKENAKAEGCDLAFFLMLAIPNMIIHDKFGQLMKKEGREQRFAELVLELYETFQQGYVSLEDLEKCLEQETGMKVEWRKSNGKIC